MLNFRHLYYFWVVTKAGGFARAAERLDMAVQTISAQVRELEKSLGHQLLKPAGRGVAMTEAGHAAFARADSRRLWHGCLCCYPPHIRRCEQSWTDGSKLRVFAPRWPVSSRTAR